MADLPNLEEIKGLRDGLINDNIGRNQKDAALLNIFMNGEFDGNLEKALRSQVRSSAKRKLIINFARKAMVDRTVSFVMLPDIKVDPPDGLPMMDSLFWQQMIQRVIEHYFWEQTWHLPQRMSDIAFYYGVKGRVALQAFPNFSKKTVDLYIRDPSTYYANVTAGSGYHIYESDGEFNPPSGGYKHCPVLFIFKAKGRDILQSYPTAAQSGVENNNSIYEMIEYMDDDFIARFVQNKAVGEKDAYKPLMTSKGEVMAIEHKWGFVPTEYIQDINIPGRIDATTSIYHALPLGENLNDLILMNTEEQRERLAQVLAIKNPLDVPNPWPAQGNAVVTMGPQGEAKYISKIANPSDMGAHIEAIKGLLYMGLGTSGARMGELPQSGTWTGKGITAAANVSVSDEILFGREKIAMGIAAIDAKAYKMTQKMWPDVMQQMTVHSDTKKEGLRFKFKDLPTHFRHKLEVFPLAHDIASTAVLMLQLSSGDNPIISKRKVREMLPGIDEAEETRRVQEEKQEAMDMMLAAQNAQMEAQAAAQGAGPESAESQAYAVEKGGMIP